MYCSFVTLEADISFSVVWEEELFDEIDEATHAFNGDLDKVHYNKGGLDSERNKFIDWSEERYKANEKSERENLNGDLNIYTKGIYSLATPLTALLLRTRLLSSHFNLYNVLQAPLESTNGTLTAFSS